MHLNGMVLCLDSNHLGFYKTLKKRHSRNPLTCKTLIAPWSQLTDEFYFFGYYDFVFLIAAKLGRIKQAISEDTFAEAIVSYSLYNTPYEKEYFELLGIAEKQVVDSKEYKIEFEEVILADMGHLKYPNSHDIFGLKCIVESKLNLQRTGSSRIYISRSTRRRIINEANLINMLKKFDFQIIEDQQRSVTEQVQLYKNATFIIGPHGASFSNIIWAEPGTHLFELFSPNYMPDFFLYLAQTMSMKYTAYCFFENKKEIGMNEAIFEDIYVCLPELEKCLNNILGIKKCIS